MRTLVFMPAFNEEGAIAGVVQELRAKLPDADVLVVDDGSSDYTAEIAQRAGARVASLPFNRGIGAAVQTGFLYALREGYDICGRVDADGQHPPEELARLLREVTAGHCDLAIGSRYHDHQGASPPDDAYRPVFARRLGIALFRSLLSLTSGQKFTDTTSGLCAANRRTIRLFAAREAPDYPELELLQRAARQGLRITELGVHMRPRAAGVTSITPWQSAYFVFKSLLTCSVGALRRRELEPEPDFGVGPVEDSS